MKRSTAQKMKFSIRNFFSNHGWINQVPNAREIYLTRLNKSVRDTALKLYAIFALHCNREVKSP